MRVLLVIALSALICCSCFIEVKHEDCMVKIVGTVFDSTTSEPLAGATIMVKGTPQGAVTDSIGRYQICGVPTGQHVLQCSNIGYMISESNVRISTTDARRVVNFALVRDPELNRQLRGVPGDGL